jgi:hypothetical protein
VRCCAHPLRRPTASLYRLQTRQQVGRRRIEKVTSQAELRLEIRLNLGHAVRDLFFHFVVRRSRGLDYDNHPLENGLIRLQKLGHKSRHALARHGTQTLDNSVDAGPERDLDTGISSRHEYIRE